jgi:hypothetical protein
MARRTKRTRRTRRQFRKINRVSKKLGGSSPIQCDVCDEPNAPDSNFCRACTLSLRPKRARPKRASPKRASPKRASPKIASPKIASPKIASPKIASPKRVACKPCSGKKPLSKAQCKICSKCDGQHSSDACPHFKKDREEHKDARPRGSQSKTLKALGSAAGHALDVIGSITKYGI